MRIPPLKEVVVVVVVVTAPHWAVRIIMMMMMMMIVRVRAKILYVWEGRERERKRNRNGIDAKFNFSTKILFSIMNVTHGYDETKEKSLHFKKALVEEKEKIKRKKQMNANGEKYFHSLVDI